MPSVCDKKLKYYTRIYEHIYLLDNLSVQQLLLNMPKRDAGSELNHDNWEVKLIVQLAGEKLQKNIL